MESLVASACRRLAPFGWRQMLLDVTGGELDITASDLKGALTRKLTKIDRTYPGFGDFDVAGVQAIEAGAPDRSLLYHAFASMTVVADRSGRELGSFPTLAEIEAVENLVYGIAPPTLEEIRRQASGHPLAIVVYALQYYNTPRSVHGRHAELCFSRAGVGRLGTAEPLYDAKRRVFTAAVQDKPFEFRVVPRRYAAYLAVQLSGAWNRFGPQDVLPDDDKRQFWVPLHKLFSGKECLKGLDLDLQIKSGLRNDLIGMFHKHLDARGLKNNWRGEHLEQHPFVIKNERIASMSQRAEFGSGVLEPYPGPLISAAEYQGRPLTFPVDGRHTSNHLNVQLSSLQTLAEAANDAPRYMADSGQDLQRPAPQYVNMRHRVMPDGSIDNLNHRPDLREILQQGGFEARHYTDGAGDGWVEAHCPQVDGKVDGHLPAYAMVGLPDFFPEVNQRELMLWWQNEVPEKIRAALWTIHPLVLSQTRIAANINLPVGFSLEDVTVTSIVSHPKSALGPVQAPNGPVRHTKTGLPDGSPGLFDPGWDTSQGIHYSSPDKIQRFLTGHGLGSPFIEDAKLCAALGNYWPGVAPDSTRTFPPDKRIGGIKYAYPTITPLTDEEIGSAPLPDGTFLSWDGVRGPRVDQVGALRYAVYPDAWHVDYIDTHHVMTAALTSRIDFGEYKTRTMSMAAVYWALGIRDPEFVGDKDLDAHDKILAAKAAWAVLSFRKILPGDPELAIAEKQSGTPLPKRPLFRFHVFRWGRETPESDVKSNPAKPTYSVRVEMLEEAIAYVGGPVVLLQRHGGAWTADTSMPT
ncbi:MAG: hypothetical protein K9G48_14375 [Reyranella sp.]|nr:hypothetical protein [Reyranella sp.]